MAETVQAKSKAPILLVEGTAADQQIMANLAALALKKVGFKVMLMAVADQDRLTALSTGDVHV
ncbi:MAG: hypothetical protein ACKVGZ_13765, partial [Alphaproteobacteria bacterium]